MESTSPPKRAISRISLDARNEWEDAEGMNSVSTPDMAWFIWAICNSLSKSETARSPLTMKSAPMSRSLLAQFAPQLSFGPRFDKTRKGSVVHLFPPPESLLRQAEPARARWIVFPRYRQGAALELLPQPPLMALTRLVNNSFNYRVTGADGFRSRCRLVRQVDSYQLVNGDLNAAVAAIEQLLAEDLP